MSVEKFQQLQIYCNNAACGDYVGGTYAENSYTRRQMQYLGTLPIRLRDKQSWSVLGGRIATLLGEKVTGNRLHLPHMEIYCFHCPVCSSRRMFKELVAEGLFAKLFGDDGEEIIEVTQQELGNNMRQVAQLHGPNAHNHDPMQIAFPSQPHQPPPHQQQPGQPMSEMEAQLLAALRGSGGQGSTPPQQPQSSEPDLKALIGAMFARSNKK